MVNPRNVLPPKLSRPSAAGLIVRERLFALLDRFRRRPITWVEGPPGAGKTSLVSSWIESRGLQCLWYQVDAGDADPATFFYYLRHSVSEGRRPLPALTPEYLPDLPGFTRRFFRMLPECMPKLAVIVLDNFQDTPGSAVLATLARDGLYELPEDITLVVLSRGDPPPAFDEAIARADLARLGWEDLRLDLDETRELAGLDATTGEDLARTLRERTGGWAAGLRLMLESNSGAAVPPNLVEAPETLFAYLANEVYERSPLELRDLWLATAYLPRFTAAMAGALAEREDTGERLEWLANQRYFIERRAGVPTTYQYHALFSEFLRRQLERDRDLATRRRLAHRSAELLADAGETETAFRLYCEAQDFRAAIPLILREAPSLLANGRWQTLQAALTALPEPLLQEAPWLLFWLGASQGMTDPAHARATIARAYHRFLETGDSTGQAMSASAVLESYFAELDHLPEIDPWLEAAERAIGAGAKFPHPAAELRFWGSLLVGLDHRRRGGSLENTAADRVQELLSLEIGVNDRLLVGSHLLHHHSMFGDQRAVAPLGAQVEAWLTQPDASPLTRIPALWSLCNHSLFLHRFDDALRLIRAAQKVIDEHGFGFAANLTRLFEAWVLTYSGDSDAAAALLAAITPAIARARKNEIALFHFLHAWLALSRGDPRAGLASAELAQQAITNRETAGPAINVHTALALAAAEIGDLDRARQAVSNARRWVDGRDRGTFRTWVLMVEADVQLRGGARAEGLALLEEAFASLRRSGSLCTVNWLRDLMNRLCVEALDAGIERETVVRLIQARGLQAPSPDITAWPWPIRIHALGRFEVAVNGEVLHHSRKAQRRALDLLKALVALGAEGVTRDAIAAALWPESDGDAAHDALDITLHRLRKLIGHDDAVLLSHGILQLNPGIAWTDAFAFERLAGRVNGEHGALEINTAERALALYTGPLLHKREDAAWLLPARERLRSRYVRLATRTAQHYEHAGCPDRTVEIYTSALEAEPLTEEIYRRLMACLAAQDRRAEALDVYRRCRHMLSVVLDVAPSRETEVLHQSIARAD